MRSFRAKLDQAPLPPVDDVDQSGATDQLVHDAAQRYHQLKDDGQQMTSRLTQAKERQRKYNDTLAKLQVRRLSVSVSACDVKVALKSFSGLGGCPVSAVGVALSYTLILLCSVVAAGRRVGNEPAEDGRRRKQRS